MALNKIYEEREGDFKVIVYWDTAWQEYRVRFYTAGILEHDADYYTIDRQDALDTAAAILKGASAYANTTS